jgi:Family of unknown function (DUF5989)
MTRLQTLVELLGSFMHTKRWRLVPKLLVVLTLFGSPLLVTQSPVVAPFICETGHSAH